MANRYEVHMAARQVDNEQGGDPASFPQGTITIILPSDTGSPKVDASPRRSRLRESSLVEITGAPSASLIPNTATGSSTYVVTTTITAAPGQKTSFGTPLEDEGGPSRSQIAAAIAVPTILIFLVGLALLCVRRRRKRQQQRAMNAPGFAKELGSFDPQSSPPKTPMPQLPMPVAQPSLSLSISTRFNNPQYQQQPQRLNVTYFQNNSRQAAPRQSSHHRHTSSNLSRKPVGEDPPPPYMPRICTTPEGIPITQMEPARLTEANLARQQTSSRHYQTRAPPQDDAVSDISGQMIHNGRQEDNMSVVSDISYRGQAPTTVHQTV